MIDSENLRTASLYINNQLLSRGLLHDGQNIDFADPEGSDGGLQATMGRVISVVNDLILRRDRDAEHRESLSSTLRTLRADALRQTTELARQTEKLDDTQRRLDIAEATERALRKQLKTAEQGIHKLKDETAKMKSLVAQTRGACANEVRKRDRQIDSLKKAVADSGRVRGGGKSRDVITISVTGEIGGTGDEGMGMPAGATESEGYSLHMETNQFLTELAKGLSEENEGLLALVQRTVEGLREMSGLDRGAEGVDDRNHNVNNQDDFVIQPPQKTAEELAAELEAIIEHLRSILTNPSFVPIEEVEVRDEAINRLRAGLDTMEARWKDAVHMIDGWRRRMVSSGRPIDMEDLQMGLRLSPVRVRDVEETSKVVPMRLSCVKEEDEEEEKIPDNHHQDEDQEVQRPRSPSPAESLRLVPAPGYEVEEPGDDSDSDSSIFQDDLDLDDFDAEEPNVQILQISTAESIDSPPLPEPPQISPLKDSYSSGNRGFNNKPSPHKRPGDFTTIIEENTWDLAVEDEKEPPAPPPHIVKPQSPAQKSKNVSPEVTEETRPSSTASYDSPLFGKSGERPSQTQLNRKLFSKPSIPEQNSRNASQINREPSPPVRSTRSNTRRSTDTPPVSTQTSSKPAKRMASDPNSTTQQKQAQATQQTASTKSPTESKQVRSSSPTRAQLASSRLPRPNMQQSPLSIASIAAKLAASEREADAARVRAKLKAVRRSRRISATANTTDENAVSQTQAHPQAKDGREIAPESESTSNVHQDHSLEEDMDPVKKDLSPVQVVAPKRVPKRANRAVERDAVDELALGPDACLNVNENGAESAQADGAREEMGGEGTEQVRVKRKRDRRTSKVASRRRSTLNPWELESLISGNIGDVESPAR
ncbi:Afadin and alpha-actinin-binding-domain-containing protein [Xylariaceae sp. FL1651]|nr:Afadin and alpha-actinin-binding-domain-containing protein [Xylariaceae sp. FL1651]